MTSVASVAPGEIWTLQTVTYNPEWLVETISNPGKGTTTIVYHPSTRLPIRVVAPDGVAVEAIERDPLTDGITWLRTTRGALAHQQFFRYDGLERLRSAWDDLGAGSEANPDVRLAYAFATATTPASVRTWTLVDAAVPAVRESVDFLTAAGEPLATAQSIPEGWAFGRLTWRDRTAGRTTGFLRPTIPASLDPASLDHGTLFAGADEVERTVAGPLGVAHESVVRLHAGVERWVAESLYLDAGRVVRDAWENGTYRTTRATDASGDPLASWDEAGTGWSYVHDALGRLREVRLPDGARHRTSYDAHGRTSRVERTGVATIEYRYAPLSGLLAEKAFLSPAGVLRRSVAFAYDSIGRVRVETHSTPEGETQRFDLYYDGATPEAPSAAGRTGLLTAVSGDGYVKRLDYRADGKITRRTLEIGTWRKVVTDVAYDEAGDQRGQASSVFSGATRLVSSSTLDEYDGHGRLRATTLNGNAFATYAFGGNGLLAGASFVSGDQLAFSYDGLTRRLSGSAQGTAAWAAATSQRMNARGLVESEAIQVGPLSLSRTYRYSAQRFLEGSTDAQKVYGYRFDPSGLPTHIDDDGVSKDLVRDGCSLIAGDVAYACDDLGRTRQRGDLTLAYGPDGQVARAQRGVRVWTFVHDEAGQRLAKLEGGVPVAAYLEEGYLDDVQLVQPVKIAGRTVGVIRNGAFETVATDLRGTVLAEADGTARIASPFGSRGAHPALADAIDYVEKGFDADLGLVRMGVRDYDPAINQFTTADPLFLEEPSRCVKSPGECNLYAYALNLPNQHTDPTGEQVRPPRVGPTVRDGLAAARLFRFNNALEELARRDPLTRRDYLRPPNSVPSEVEVYRIEAQVRTLRAMQESPLGLHQPETLGGSPWTVATTPWQRQVFRRNDIDWALVRPEGAPRAGLTNWDAARLGYAPGRLNPETGRCGGRDPAPRQLGPARCHHRAVALHPRRGSARDGPARSLARRLTRLGGGLREGAARVLALANGGVQSAPFGTTRPAGRQQVTERQWFFVAHLGERGFRPDPLAKYCIQLLDENGQSVEECYVDEHGVPVAPCSFAVPRAVVEAAFRQEHGRGDYVDPAGRSVRPF